jgi:hypothetical protein
VKRNRKLIRQNVSGNRGQNKAFGSTCHAQRRVMKISAARLHAKPPVNE